MQPIIVHGGGKEITKWLNLLGHESKFVEGLRVTDELTMEVAEMVLGKVTKTWFRWSKTWGESRWY